MSDPAIEYRAEFDLICPIADALQLKLFYNVTEKGARIRGAEKMSIPIDAKGDETIPFEIKVHASTVGENEAWALLKVRGNLWVLVGYLKQGRELQLCMIDGSKAYLWPLTADNWSGMSLSGLLEKIGRGVVTSYYRRKEESEWRQLDDVPVDLVAGQAGETPAGDRAATEAGERGEQAS